MTLQEKAKKTVKKLLFLTQERQIGWKRQFFLDHIERTHNLEVEVAYSVLVDEHYFLIYEGRHKNVDEYEDVYWENRVHLELVDMYDDDRCEYNLIWALPYSRAMRDLLEAVRIKTEHVEEKHIKKS